MTALDRLARMRDVLTAVVIGYALLWGAATVAALLLALRLVNLALGRTMAGASAFPVLALGLAVTVFILWRGRKVRSPESVALWLEWRVPAMRYSLVTLAEGFAGAAPLLEARVAETSWTAPVRRAVLRRLQLPTVILVLAVTGLLLVPVGSPGVTEVAAHDPGVAATGRKSSDPFQALVVTVTPPPYSRLPQLKLEHPEAISSLVGSAIRIDGDGWSVNTIMPDTAMPYWLVQGGERRLLVLLPVPDSVPVVQLLAPSRDSVLHTVIGGIRLLGRARDDYGLAQVWFEYIVSSGEGENFTFRSGVIGRRTLSGDSLAELASSLRLDSLQLTPGNIVHLRAVAQDGNVVTGPSIGFSDTRTIRIPRPGEGDSVSVDQAAPAQGDSSLLSQRMLISLAEALERRRPRLPRDTLVAESRGIARDQATLRRRVADIIFLRLGSEASMEEREDSAGEPLTPEALLAAAEEATSSGGELLDFREDETPVVALNRPLLEAYNAMWSAGRELEIGAPRRALPHMREALEAIQRARQAERIYLRGGQAAVVVDLAKVRLAGKLADASPAALSAPSRNQRIREALLARYRRLIDLLPSPAVADSLQLLRIDALESEPRFAAALGAAVSALHTGRDATGALIRARRLLAGPPRPANGLGAWDVAP